MKRVLMFVPALLLAVSAILAPAAAQGAVPQHHVAAVHTAACTSTYDWGTGLHNSENGGWADWESNPCHFTFQVEAVCNGGAYTHGSGEVSGTEVTAWATCNLGDCWTVVQIDPQDTNHWKVLATDYACTSATPRQRHA